MTDQAKSSDHSTTDQNKANDPTSNKAQDTTEKKFPNPGFKAGTQDEKDKTAATQDGSTVRTAYYTKDGVPVEPSSIPATNPIGPVPDARTRPDVVEVAEHVDADGNITKHENATDQNV